MRSQLAARPCVCGCGRLFTPSRRNQVRRPQCRNRGRNKHDARTRRRLAHEREFVAIDGEGITWRDDSGELHHDYVLISCGRQHLHHDGARLGFIEIAAFLYECFRQAPDAVYVGYYLGYDFAQWLRALPQERAERLLTDKGMASRRRTSRAHLPPFPVEWQGWEFDTMALRRFKLRPAGVRWGRSDHPWLTICDVGPFYQSSFLAAIDPAKWPEPIVTEREYRMIEKGKHGRAGHRFSRSMIRYNQLECDVLSRLMVQQNKGLTGEGLRLNKQQWFGPGQVAQKWLGLIKAPTGEQVRAAVPAAFREAARASYFGGWFEIFWHGPREGRAYAYDINSAYPAVMAELPCLLHGTYKHDIGPTVDLLQLAHARVRGSHGLIGAMLHRTKKGTVCRPSETEGWFWTHELRAAQYAGLIDHIETREILSYIPCGCPPPLAPIAELYQGRLAVGKNTPEGRAKRLIYNSAYGKFAQSVGTPTYGNPVYASLITAGCRCRILELIGTHQNPASLLMVATDGAVFAEPHQALHADPVTLGAWSASTYDNLSLFMPGVYWDDATRARLAEGKAPSLKSRGISARDLGRRIAIIDRAWSRFNSAGWPRLVLPIEFQMISPRQALARGDWSLCGQVAADGQRIISADPKLKRDAAGPGFSRPYRRVGGEVRSTAYDRRFGEEMETIAAMEFGDHPDAPIGSVLMREIWR